MKKIFAIPATAVVAVGTAVTAFASEPAKVAITSEMLNPLVDSVTANIGVILPVGIVIFGILIGVSMVPGLIKKFTKA